MLLNPSIGKLNAEDLNQRYRNSVIEYDGVFRWCNFFEDSELCYLGQPIENPESTKFDWRKVNCERVPTGWVPAGKRIAYLCYSDARQYSRGYQEVANTQLLTPWTRQLFDPNEEGIPRGVYILIGALEAAAKMYRGRTFVAKTSNLNDIDDYQIVNRRVAITRLVKSPFFRVWYRTMLVAYTDLNVVITKTPLFVDDLREFFPQMKVQVSQMEFTDLHRVSYWSFPIGKRKAPLNAQPDMDAQEVRRANQAVAARRKIEGRPAPQAEGNPAAEFLARVDELIEFQVIPNDEPMDDGL